MTVELRDLISDLPVNALAAGDWVLSSLAALFSAGMPNGMDPGELGAGALAGGAAAAAAGAGAGGGGTARGDRGFRYTGTGDNTYRDSLSSDGTVVGVVPSGMRLVYDSVVRDANGTPTHYHVNPPGGGSGYLPAGSTSDTRPTMPPPARPSVVIDSGVDLARSSSAQTAGSRG